MMDEAIIIIIEKKKHKQGKKEGEKIIYCTNYCCTINTLLLIVSISYLITCSKREDRGERYDNGYQSPKRHP